MVLSHLKQLTSYNVAGTLLTPSAPPSPGGASSLVVREPGVQPVPAAASIYLVVVAMPATKPIARLRPSNAFQIQQNKRPLVIDEGVIGRKGPGELSCGDY